MTEKEKPRTQSKELKAILTSIEKYCKKHKNKMMFHLAIMAFKGKNNDIVDDGIFAFGNKKALLVSIKDMKKGIKKDKTDFINW